MQSLSIQLRGVPLKLKSGFYDEFWTAAERGTWEPTTFSALERWVAPDRVVIDVGASVGPVSLYAAHLAQQVHSLEPDPVNYAELEINLAMNPALAQSVSCHPLALSPSTGRGLLHSSRFFGDSSASLLTRSGEAGDTVEIDCIRYTDFLQQNDIDPRVICLIKMDIEGGEFDLIPDMEEALREDPVPLLLSLHGPYLYRHYVSSFLPIDILARIVLKLERVSHIPLLSALVFRPLVRRRYRKVFKCLEHYRYRYDAEGRELDVEAIMANAHAQGQVVIFSNSHW